MDIFVKKPVLAIVLSLVLVLAGVWAALRIPVLQFPKLESSSLIVSTVYPGASADVVQGFITDPIERAAMTVPGVDYVESTSAAGVSTVTARLKLNEDSTDALAELSSRLNQVASELPPDAFDPSVSVQRADQQGALFYLNVRSDGWSRAEITDYVSRNVSPQLAGINGVQRIELEGGRDPAMRIWLDPVRLSAVGIGANEVLGALASNNVIAAIGRTESSEQRVNLQTNATLSTVEDFEQLIIRNDGDVLLRLRDVASVELGEDRGDSVSRLDQSTTVFIAVFPLPGANAIKIGNEVYERLDEINTTLPRGLSIDIGYDATTYMRNSLHEIFVTLGETVVLVGLVVLLLMGALRTALVPLITIPISILGSIAVISAIGFSLNLLTILAIVLSVGLVVDDAIVVVENVARHMRDGKSRIEAALVSSRELLTPIIAMTVTLAAVYAPIGFIDGLTGALFREFAFTLAVAVLISGIVAITLSPIMSAYVSADKGKEGRGTRYVNAKFDSLRHFYSKLLDRVFEGRTQVLAVSFIFALLTVPFYQFSAKELAPTEDQGMLLLLAEGPPDARVEYISEKMDGVIEALQTIPEVTETWQVLTPSGGFGGIQFVDYGEREMTADELRGVAFGALSQVSDLRLLPVLPTSLPTAGQFEVEMVVQGPDSYEEMWGYVYQLVNAAYASGQFLFADSDLKINQPSVRLNFDHDRIADLGLNVSSVSTQLSALIAEQDVGRFNDDGKSYRVIPMVGDEARHTPDSILDLPISVPSGEILPLRTFATLENLTGPQTLGTFNQQRAFRIRGAIAPGATSESALSAIETAAAEILPETYSIDYAGVSRPLRQEGNSMMSVLMVSLAVVYLLLTVQFNSFRSPLVVLVGSVPLAISGAMMFSFLGLTTINIYAQIGLITLVGLIAKNGILITEFANELHKNGHSKVEAAKEAAKVRLRPILMTTFATVIGHFPLVLVTGAGAEARNSIGIILVAGMAIGTIFTLFVLPCVYLILGDNFPVTAKDNSSEPVEAPQPQNEPRVLPMHRVKVGNSTASPEQARLDAMAAKPARA